MTNNGDEIIDDAAVFYRRIYRGDKRYIDKKTGRPTSRAFKPRPIDSGELSVDWSLYTNPEESCSDIVKFTLFSITNSTIKSIDLKAIYQPTTYIVDNREIENNAHCYVFGFDEEDESKAGILARSSILVL